MKTVQLFFIAFFLFFSKISAQNYIVPDGAQIGFGSSQGSLLRLGLPFYKGIGIGIGLGKSPFSQGILTKPNTNVSGEIFYTFKISDTNTRFHFVGNYGSVYYSGNKHSFFNPNLYGSNVGNDVITVVGSSINIASIATHEINLVRNIEEKRFYTSILPILGINYNSALLKIDNNKTPQKTESIYLNFGSGVRFNTKNFHFGLMVEGHYGANLKEAAITIGLGGKIN
jgi:hypothetical protein